MRKARISVVFAASILMLATPTLTNAQPDHVQLGNLVNRGNALLRANHFQEAVQTYQKVLELDPNCAVAKDNIAETYNNWGIFYFKQHKFREALEQLDKCLSLKPNHANARRNLSIVNNAASQMGVNVEEPVAPGPGGSASTSVATFNPLTGGHLSPGSAPAGSAPAKPTQTKSGSTVLQAGITSAKAQTPVTVPEVPSAGAVMMTPGVRVESPPEDSFTTVGGVTAIDPTRPVSSAPVSSAASQAVGASSQYKASFSTGYTPTPTPTITPQTQPAAPDTFNLGGRPPDTAPQALAPPQTVFPTQMVTQPQVQVQPQAPYEPVSVIPPAPPPAVRSAGAGTSVDEQLGAVEMKMYGSTQNTLTVLQRLEKMEREVSGQVRSGSIMDRITFLKQSIGM